MGPMSKTSFGHTITRKMPVITKGAEWMSNCELQEAIATLDHWDPIDADGLRVKAQRMTRLTSERIKRERLGRWTDSDLVTS